MASQNVLDEVSFAIGENKTVVPVLMAACAIPLRLHRLQHVDFTRGYDAGLTRLLATLGVVRAAPEPPPPPPPRPPVEADATPVEPEVAMHPADVSDSGRRLMILVGIAAAALVLVSLGIWSSQRSSGGTDTKTEATADAAPIDTPAPAQATPPATALREAPSPTVSRPAD